MPIPNLKSDGLLPVGVHDCSLEEIKGRFGTFKGNDARPRLFEKLEAFVQDVKATGVVPVVLVDGSFVTGKDRANDIDLILVVRADHDFSADLSPAMYNVLSKRRVQRRYGIDLLVARDGSVEYQQWVDFFQRSGLILMAAKAD